MPSNNLVGILLHIRRMPLFSAFVFCLCLSPTGRQTILLSSTVQNSKADRHFIVAVGVYKPTNHAT